MGISRSEAWSEATSFKAGGPDPPAYRQACLASVMDLRSDESALGTLGWILVIFILLVLFGFIGFSINT
jgi:hypothetical protein